MKSKQPPRASLCITLLTDEEYRTLMASRGGAEAFGVFVALCVTGRERLQAGKAHQVEGTASLRFENGLTHVLDLAAVGLRQFEACVSLIRNVTAAAGGEPWLSLDESGRLVIRSFFKFNTKSGWGGARPGAGRPSGNQDDFELVSSGPDLDSSRFPSVSGSVSESNPPLAPPRRGRQKTIPTLTPEQTARLMEAHPNGQ